MFKKLKVSYWFVFGLLIWAVIAYLRDQKIVIPVVNDYLTDLYSVPMYSYTIMKIMHLTYSPNWKPDIKFLVGAALNLTIVFEVICPLLSPRYTADPIDVICYFTGAGIYYFVLKKFSRRPCVIK